MAADARFVPAPDAVEILTALAGEQLAATADALTPAILGNVPVVQGTALKSYNPTVTRTPDGARWAPNSPFWHFLEYGTATNPPYRPIQLGVASLGLRFEAT